MKGEGEFDLLETFNSSTVFIQHVPSLETFKARLDRALSSLTYLKHILCVNIYFPNA